MELDYKVDRSENCVKINTDKWLTLDTNMLSRYRISGRSVITYLTRIVDKNLTEKWADTDKELPQDSVVLISRVASEVARNRAYQIDGENFYDIPITQVMGYFKDNAIDLLHFVPLSDKVLIKKINLDKQGFVHRVNDNSTVGKVLKTGSSVTSVSESDIVLIQDNVATELEVGFEKFLIVPEETIVGIFNSEENLSVDNLRVINKAVLLQEYQSSKVFDSSVLIMPELNYEELDFSDTFNSDLFKVVAVDESLHEISKNDIILLDRNLTFYVFLNGEKYFLINGTKYISGKLQKEGV